MQRSWVVVTSISCVQGISSSWWHTCHCIVTCYRLSRISTAKRVSWLATAITSGISHHPTYCCHINRSWVTVVSSSSCVLAFSDGWWWQCKFRGDVGPAVHRIAVTCSSFKSASAASPMRSRCYSCQWHHGHGVTRNHSRRGRRSGTTPATQPITMAVSCSSAVLAVAMSRTCVQWWSNVVGNSVPRTTGAHALMVAADVVRAVCPSDRGTCGVPRRILCGVFSSIVGPTCSPSACASACVSPHCCISHITVHTVSAVTCGLLFLFTAWLSGSSAFCIRRHVVCPH